MRCIYCGNEVKQYKSKLWCATCDNKLPSAKRFVEECERFKERIGYDKIIKERANESN